MGKSLKYQKREIISVLCDSKNNTARVTLCCVYMHEDLSLHVQRSHIEMPNALLGIVVTSYGHLIALTELFPFCQL